MRRALAITAVAVAVLAGFFLIPSRPRLTHMDFVAGGPDALEFCDAANPRFLPVVARSSPVQLRLAAAAPGAAGREVKLELALWTNTGKALAAADLRTTGARKLNLFAIDPSLTDFQVLEPQAGRPTGWGASFTPRSGGTYRIFADFTPAATGEEMYVSADLAIQGAAATGGAGSARLTADRGGREYRLSSTPSPVRIREPAIFALQAVPAEREPAGGSELVAVDRARSGLVVLRLGPNGTGRVSFPDSGTYAVWACVRGAGGELSVPFSVAVEP